MQSNAAFANQTQTTLTQSQPGDQTSANLSQGPAPYPRARLLARLEKTTQSPSANRTARIASSSPVGDRVSTEEALRLAILKTG